MKVVRLWTAGSDHRKIAQLPIQGLAKGRNSSEVTGNPGMGSSLDVGSMIQPDAPLGLHPDVLSLLVTGIAVNSNANLRLDSSPSGGHLSLHSAGRASADFRGTACCFKIEISSTAGSATLLWLCLRQALSTQLSGHSRLHLLHNHPPKQSLFLHWCQCHQNDCCIAGEMLKIGNRTECALLELARKLGADYQKLRDANHTVQVLTSSRLTSVSTSASKLIENCTLLYQRCSDPSGGSRPYLS